MIARYIVIDALFAAGNRKQFPIQRNVPMPIQTRLLKSQVKRGPMSIPLRISQRAVYIKNKCLNNLRILYRFSYSGTAGMLQYFLLHQLYISKTNILPGRNIFHA
jgi:hypothetical protein